MKALFVEAMEMPEERRARFLDTACAGDGALRARVEELLASHHGAGDLMGAPTGLGEEGAGGASGASESPGERVGSQIGRYRLVGVIGEGGFGTVYRAEQSEPIQRRVALKVIKLGMDTRAVIARFDQERQALALMSHPNIARVFDAGSTEQGRPYFVMELIEGVPITAYCDAQRLTPRQRLELFVPVCQAVQHAHQKGIIHRDIKPSNVLVTVQDGRAVPKVIDFGIAKATAHTPAERTILTTEGQLLGTPQYMSPEQVDLSGLDVDTRCDVYGLGVLLYELLIGATPFDPGQLRAAGLAEIQRIIREVDPPKLSTRLGRLENLASVAATRRTEPRRLGMLVRGDLDWIVMKSLEKERARRYDTADSLGADLQRYLANEPVLAAPPGAAYRARKFVRRHRGPVLAAAIVGLALMGGVTGTSTGLARARAALRSETLQRRQAEELAGFMERVFQGVGPSVALGRDTAMLKFLMDEAAHSLESGEMRGNPEAEVRLRVTIGRAYVDIAAFDAAEPQLAGALALAERTWTGDHDLTAACLNELGTLRYEQGRASEAEPLVRRALEMRQRLHPGDSEEVAASLNDQAYLWQQLGRVADALPIFEASLEMRRRLHHGDHPTIAVGLANTAYCMVVLGRWEEGLAQHREAQAMRRRLYTGDHPELVISSNNVATSLMLVGRAAEAREEFEVTLAMIRRLYPADHPTLAQLLLNVGYCEDRMGKPEEGLAKFEEALGMYRRIHRDRDHEQIAMALEEVGVALQRRGRSTDAEARLRECMAMRERVYPAGHPLAWKAAWTGCLLGSVVQAQGRFADAEPLLLAAYAALKEDPNVPPPSSLRGAGHTRVTLERIIRLYQAWDQAEPGTGRDAEGARWKAVLDASP